ncbi:MAG: hypothetical protein BVN28_08590 [Nitrospira sp. ST-bin4]|jgi:hypothetical protein|nr:MAG: hypothetical protein BVN28_08590 [Nitrospira sp. ST-bin4]
MPLDSIPLGSVSEEHLLRLPDDREQESKTIEFKLELPGSGYEDHKKFLAAITSFANTVGGDLIYGVKAPNGVAEEVIGLNGDLDAAMGRLENLVRTAIQPRVTAYNLRLIPLSNGNKVLVFRVSRSWTLPHRVTLGGHDKFYGRNSTGKYELDVPQLRSLFLLSESTADRIRNFRAERISLILSDQTPIALAPGPKTVLHVVPFDTFSGGYSFDVSRIFDSNILPLRPLTTNGGFSSRHNFDGTVTYSPVNRGIPPPSYLQLFRSGILELVDTRRIRAYDNGQLMIPGTGWEVELLGAVHQYFDIQANLGVTPPIVVMLSLLYVKGAKMYVGPHYFPMGEDKVDRDHLLVPEVMAESFSTDIAQLLKPTFDVVWNACGYSGSQGYGVDGQRKPPQ